MSLRISHAHTRITTPIPLPPQQLAAWDAEFAAQDGAALAARWVQPDEWLLIRRLPLHLQARLDAADSEFGRAFASALDCAIGEALAAGTAIRYAHRRAALADLVYRSSLGETERQWAWQRLGLIDQRDRDPETVLRQALRLVEREPELAWPVLHRLWQGEGEAASFTAALRALGGSLVPALLRLAPRSRGYVAVAAATARAIAPRSADARTLLNWCQRRALLAQRHRAPLAILLAAIEVPASGLRPAARREQLARAQAALQAVLEASNQPSPVLAPAARRAAAPAPVEPTPRPTLSLAPDAAPTPTPAAHVPATAAPRMAPPLPEPSPGPGERTDWGGALFWLTRLHAAWTALDPQPELLALLHATALRLVTPESDPVFAAFCGGTTWRDELPADARAAAEVLFQGWESWLAEAAPDWPEPRVETVCRRSGWLRCEPGWVELQLPMASVDTVLRRLLLDLDPGWLPWLGCVVRIGYVDE